MSNIAKNTHHLTVKLFINPRAGIDDVIKAMEETGLVAEINGKNMCEGCSHNKFPGIRWPASPDGDSSLGWVNKCDTCQRFPDDLAAAIHIAKTLNRKVGLAVPHASQSNKIWVAAMAYVGQKHRGLYRKWYDGPIYTTPYINGKERDK